MLKLIEAPKNENYRQESQTRSVLFSMVTLDDEKQEATCWFDWVKCKDYLGDILYSKKFGAPARVYGFDFDYTKVKDNPEFLELAVKFGNSEFEMFRQNLGVLHRIEEQNGLILSEVFETEKANTVVFIADPFWKSDTHYLSLYSWLIRLFTYKKLTNDFITELEEEYKKNYSPEISRWNLNRERMAEFLKDMKNYPSPNPYWETKYKIQDINMWHNYTGIVYFLTPAK
jgi:hypothetical protein